MESSFTKSRPVDEPPSAHVGSSFPGITELYHPGSNTKVTRNLGLLNNPVGLFRKTKGRFPAFLGYLGTKTGELKNFFLI